jgi:hypothetical protein
MPLPVSRRSPKSKVASLSEPMESMKGARRFRPPKLVARFKVNSSAIPLLGLEAFWLYDAIIVVCSSWDVTFLLEKPYTIKRSPKTSNFHAGIAELSYQGLNQLPRLLQYHLSVIQSLDDFPISLFFPACQFDQHKTLGMNLFNI